MTDYSIDLQEVYAARRRVRAGIRHTPLVPAPELGGRGGEVFLKLENQQVTGAFKARGALNALLNLPGPAREKGVIAFSTGNHGRAVAWAARQMGIPAVICLSRRVPAYRIEAMRAQGAEVVQAGESQDEATAAALDLQQRRGLTLINPFDDPQVIAGQGTIALELLEDLPDLDAVVVPLSGGGLIAGIACVLKAARPGIRVIGVSMAAAPAMYHSIRAGKPVEIEERDSLADALLGGIGLDNRYTFAMVRDLVDDIVLVSEEEIAAGMVHAYDCHRQVVEGSGAVGIAALLHGRIANPGRRTAVVVSGGFVAPRALFDILAAHYAG